MLLKLVAPEGAIFFIINAWGSPRSKTRTSTEGSRITRRRWIAGKQFEASELSTCRDRIVVFVPHFYIFVLFTVGHFVGPAVVGFLTFVHLPLGALTITSAPDLEAVGRGWEYHLGYVLCTWVKSS
jgi:hypothetical protein